MSDADSERELATFDAKTWTRGGSMELDGRAYELHVKGLMTEHWRWERDGEEVVRFHDKQSFGKEKGVIELLDRDDPNVALLALLSVHVNIGSDQSTMASMTAVNASVIAST